MVKDPHGPRELKIFRKFAKLCPIAIDQTSIKKKNPPLPDILCRMKAFGETAFEMVELIDKTLAAHVLSSFKNQQILNEEFNHLDPVEKALVLRVVQNALVHVDFHPDATAKVRKKEIPAIIRFLGTIDPNFEGVVTLNSSLTKVLRRMRIIRGCFPGPFFEVCSVGSFSDPTLEKINKKFSKSYESPFPVELLIYFELQTILPEWLLQIKDFLLSNQVRSPFRRIWIFDLPNKKVLHIQPEFL